MRGFPRLVPVAVLSALVGIGSVSAIGMAGEMEPLQDPRILGPDVMGGYASNYILIKLRSGVEPVYFENGALAVSEAMDQLMEEWGVLSARPALRQQPRFLESARRIGLDRWHHLNVPTGTDTPAMQAAFAELVDVIEVTTFDVIGGPTDIPNDPSFSEQYALHNTGQTGGTPDADIDGPEAWDIWTGDGSITLAVIDSGVYPHSEFADRMVPGWNTNANNDDTSDGCPHGTHVAGIAGAMGNNGVGVAGVNWGVNIMPVRVLNGCGGTPEQCADGIIWAVDHGANVGTMSLQYGYTYNAYFHDSAIYAQDNNVLMVAATANFGGAITYPAKFDEVMAIGATDHRDNRVSWSCFGPEIDVVAPGLDIYNTWIGNSYTYLSGTSMATPHASGLATLIWSYDPALTASEVWALINASADDLQSEGWDEFTGWGRINAFNALEMAHNPLNFDYPNGRPALLDPDGGTTMRVEVIANDGTPVSGSGRLYYNDGSGWVWTAMDEVSPNVYDAVFPAFDCLGSVNYFVSADTTEGETDTDPPGAPDRAHSAFVAQGSDGIFSDDFSTHTGWTVSYSDLTDGRWERAMPTGRGGPDADFDGSGWCVVTDNEDYDDVDGGPTRWTSPRINVSDGDAYVSYAYWHKSNGGTFDPLTVQVSGNDGGNWATVVSHEATDGNWEEAGFFASDFITPSRNVRVRFLVMDNPDDSSTESAVDAFNVEVFYCDRMPLDVTPLNAGQDSTLSVSEATPNDTVYFVYSLAGYGGTYVPSLGITLDLSAPQLIDSATADGSGNAAIVAGVPGSARGLEVFLQAAQNGRKSTVYSQIVN